MAKPRTPKREDAGEHLGRSKHPLHIEDEIADAAVAGDHLGHDDDDQRDAEADAHAGQDAGQRRGQHDLTTALRNRDTPKVRPVSISTGSTPRTPL